MKVFIDPGHNYSGADTGAAGFGAKEQIISFEIGEQLKTLLENSGLQVKQSRDAVTDNLGSGDVSSSLNVRANMANTWSADIFCSIHCNASNGAGHGCETYSYPGSAKGAELAGDIQKYLAADSGLTNRGTKTANYAVLRQTNMPAVLVETGFIDNREDNAVLTSESGQRAIAGAIAKGICEFLGIAYSPQGEETAQKEEPEMIYNYMDENMPEWARDTVQKLMDKGALQGNENGELGLTDDLLRMLVINDRMGLYDK